jgi:F-type H+-transporting ATPase subunit b
VISLDWTLGLQFVNFIILLIILNKFLYRPLQKIFAERRQTIDGSHQRAKSLDAEVEVKMQHYLQQLSDAKLVANEARGRLKKAAAEEEAVLLSAAHSKAAARLQVIKAQVAAESTEAGKTLRGEAETLAGQIATKILGRQLA